MTNQEYSKTIRICATCKHNPPSKKWPCEDCDMRESADRWEPKEVKDSTESSLTQKGLDTISRRDAIDEIEYELEMINSALDSITLDFNAREKLLQRRGEAREILNSIQQLPPAQPEQSEITDEQAILHLQSTGWMQNHDREMYESGLREQLADDSGSYDSLIPCEDAISRTAAIDIFDDYNVSVENGELEAYSRDRKRLCDLPSVQPTLHGYNIEHLELIARVLQKEDLPPERIVEALTDIGRIVAIVKDEFEEALRKAVEQCTM